MIWTIYLIFIPFIFIGAVIAYLITYNEYQHHYQTKREPRRLALEAAVFTFIVFSLMMAAAPYILINFIEK